MDEEPDFSGDAKLVCVNNDPDTPIDTYGHPAPSFYDWDGDGDLDLVCGNFVDDVLYFQNIGTRTEPVYAEGVPVKHADGSNVQLELCMLTTTTFDWNRDGLPDLLVGEEDGRVCYYENTGDFAVNGAPVFEKARYFKTPADNLSVGILCTPVSIDWDGDGDEDLFSGDSAGFFSYIENITPAGEDLTDPIWAPPVRLTDEQGKTIRIIAGPNGSIQGPAEEKWGYTVLSMGDWDGDGDADIIANSIWGKIVFIENLNNDGEYNNGLNFSAPVSVRVEDEAPDKPSWNWWDPEPYELVSQWRTTPYMIDLNEDGLMDLVMQDYEGYLAFYERYQENGELKLKPGERIFLNSTGGELRLNSGSQGSSGRTKLLLVDWDGDGDLDIVRNDGTSVAWMQNIGDEDTPYKFANQVNLHSRKIASHTTSPTVCDWNEDGVPDLIVGAEDGHFYYFENKTSQYNPDNVTADPADHLVAHWDFVGEDDSERLADKSTKGEDHDALTVVGTSGTTEFLDGTVAITGDGGLMANDSKDLSPTQEVTIFFKARITGASNTTGTNYFSLIDKRSFNSTPTYGNQRAFGIFGDTTGTTPTMTAVVGTSSGPRGTLPTGEWREFAMVVSNDGNGTLTKTLYVSQTEQTGNGEDFVAVTATMSGTAIQDTSNPFMIGNEVMQASGNYRNYENLTREYADVRVYDMALTADQIASILPGPSSDKYMVAHWDFEGDDLETQLKDKAALDSTTASTTADDINALPEGISIADGVATVAKTSTNALDAGNLADVNQPGPMTIFMKVKVGSGTINGNYLGLADKRQFSSGDNKRAYTIGVWNTGEVGGAIYADGSGRASDPMIRDAWRELALVIDKDTKSGALIVKGYISKNETTCDGSDYVQLFSKDTNYTSLITDAAANLWLGRDRDQKAVGVDVSYDDVRIYNKALTADELAAILEGPDTPTLEAPVLKSLGIGGVNLFPVFSSGTTSYTTRVAHDVESLTVNATAKKDAVITVNGIALTDDAAAVNLEDGVNTIIVKCAHTEDESVYTEYTISLTREASGDDLTGKLVAKWDFEGEDETEQLSDKGDNSAKTDLTKTDGTNLTNDIVLENGRAIYASGKKSYLAAQGTGELSITGDLTLVARVKLDKVNGVLGIVDHRHFSNPNLRPYGMFISESGTKGYYGIGGQIQNGSTNALYRSSTYDNAKLGEWATLAMVVKNENGKMTMYHYVSTCAEPTSGSDFVLISAPASINAASLEASDQYLYVGNNTDMKVMNGDMEIDEVRIYDAALTMEQLAGLDMYIKDASALQMLIDRAKSKTESDYTSESWAALQNALNAAGAVDMSDPVAVNDAYKVLDQAIDSLIPMRQSVEYYTIEDLIELVKEADAKNSEDYTLDSWGQVQVAVNNADLLIEDNISPLPTPAAIKEAYLALRTALDSLELRPDENVLNAEKVASAKTSIEAADFTIEQAVANSPETIKPLLLDKLNQLIAYTGIELQAEDIEITTLLPAASGTNGSYTFKVKLTAGQAADTAEKTGNVITASRVSSGGGSSAVTYSIIVENSKNGSVTANRKIASKGTNIILTVVPDEGYSLKELRVVDNNGDVVTLNEKNGKYTFRMPDSKVTVQASFEKDNTALNPFADVHGESYYYDAVLWAVNKGITGGTSATTFSPDAACTRAQTVTFLWAAAGRPAPKSSEMPFKDVAAGAYYRDAVLWAVENGITSGTSATTFSPDTTCTRAQIVTFLWRAQKSPSASIATPFTDVAIDSYYAGAVQWASEEGITDGTSATTFSPNNDCTRAQIVTFLWKCMK